jgi:hypothetical protein
MYKVYIGDPNEGEIISWLQEHVGDIAWTYIEDKRVIVSQHEVWALQTVDVSDTSREYDEVTEIEFADENDAIMFCLAWGKKYTR